MTPFEQYSICIGLGGLFLIWLQLRADHDRRKKQATIEFMNTVRPIWLEHEQKCHEAIGKKDLSEDDIHRIIKDDQLREIVKNLLGKLEYMSVGMNTGVFDKHILYRMASTYLIRIYHRLYPYIKHIQLTENEFAYIEFKELVLGFEKRKKKKPDPRGRIWIS